MPYVEGSDGAELYIKEWGDGPAVVLLHGWPLNADSWDDQAYAIANAGFRVIAYDRRGFGRSEQAWDGYDYDTLADDLAAVIEATEADNPVLIGFSMGGGEVARFLTRFPGQARAAVLVASVVPYLLQDGTNPDGAPEAVFDEIKAGILEDRPKFLAGFMKSFYGAGLISSPVSAEVIDWSTSLALQAGLKGTLDCVDAFAKTDFRPDLASFTVPTLIIHGTADKTVPIDISGRAAARAIPGSQLIEYDGAPHGLLATHKDKVTADLLTFLRGLDAA
ncbi:alpha/beta fold hydrolase [Glacieibacterium frigidum]|uniref:Alpha/beta hydrolase n=1 Tax=Glacieibacterium frigidum TaxID=2593303 RepID=A0A552UFY3_9SPHN|nr:alpha/beta hydrolase [Glacieibacterium frigidum]TRW17099.1 alpha/beta hydrolase [Glacieibacterium frigidum]